MRKHVVGWKLDRGQRDRLLALFPPRYADAVADHVTLAAKVGKDEPLPEPATAEIVGRANDGTGVEAMVVAVDGSTERPGGGRFHITWSLARGRNAKESNDVIAAHGWEAVEGPFTLDLKPARWP